MEVNHLSLLRCSLEKELLVECNYSTLGQCIIFLNSLVVLFGGNLLKWVQFFSGEILWYGGNFPRGQLSWGNCPGTISRGGGKFYTVDGFFFIKRQTSDNTSSDNEWQRVC